MDLVEILLVTIICVTLIVLLIIFVLVCVVQEQRHKEQKVERISRKDGTYYLQGVQRAEAYIQEYGFEEIIEYSNKNTPVTCKNEIDNGFIDYVDYYKEHLHLGIMLPLSNINKDNNPQGDKMVTLPKDFDQACKNFHTIEESRWKQALRKRIDTRKQELSKFGFKENIRW